MKQTFILIFVIGIANANAQQVVDVNNENKNIAFKEITYNVGGQNAVKYVDFKSGSPFFKDEWLSTSLLLNNGTVYKGLQGRLDIMSGGLIYKNDGGAELVAQAPIKEIEFIQSDNRYVFINSSSIPGASQKKSWYQQLNTGKVLLYKELEKTIVEQRPFNSATVEQFIKTTERFYLLKDGKFIPVKKVKDLLEALADKSAALENYKKTSSTEKNFLDIVAHYNSLFK